MPPDDHSQAHCLGLGVEVRVARLTANPFPVHPKPTGKAPGRKPMNLTPDALHGESKEASKSRKPILLIDHSYTLNHDIEAPIKVYSLIKDSRLFSLSSRQEQPAVRGLRLLDSMRLDETDVHSPAVVKARKSGAGIGGHKILAIAKLCRGI